jgi:hypothetical protein
MHESIIEKTTLRDKFAMSALQGYLASNPEDYAIDPLASAKFSYEIADAMLKIRAEKEVFLLTYLHEDGSFSPSRRLRFVENKTVGLAILDNIEKHWKNQGLEVEREPDLVRVFAEDCNYIYHLEEIKEVKENEFIFLI